ncbi:MAG: hypothetical protein ABR549_17140, partial [Mycobacteriales bacterium]
LVLSPFGSDRPGATTFAPSQAVVASGLHSNPATRDLATSTSIASSSLRSGAGVVAPAARQPHDVGSNPLAPLNNVPCTTTKGSVLPTALPAGLPAGLAVGGSGCWRGTDIGVGPDLPQTVVDKLGYDHVTVSTNVVTCDQVHRVTTQTQLIQCSETQK